MRETKLYAKLQPYLSSWGAVDRIENSLVSGMPDVLYTIGGASGFIETKIAKNGVLAFERFQMPWFTRHTRQGLMRLFVICSDEQGETILVLCGKDVLEAPKFLKRKSSTSHLVWTCVSLNDVKPKLMLPLDGWGTLREMLISGCPC